eukprot:7951656-Pyramimonas_sp.AAC.1
MLNGPWLRTCPPKTELEESARIDQIIPLGLLTLLSAELRPILSARSVLCCDSKKTWPKR